MKVSVVVKGAKYEQTIDGSVELSFDIPTSYLELPLGGIKVVDDNGQTRKITVQEERVLDKCLGKWHEKMMLRAIAKATKIIR